MASFIDKLDTQKVPEGPSLHKHLFGGSRILRRGRYFWRIGILKQIITTRRKEGFSNAQNAHYADKLAYYQSRFKVKRSLRLWYYFFDSLRFRHTTSNTTTLRRRALAQVSALRDLEKWLLLSGEANEMDVFDVALSICCSDDAGRPAQYRTKTVTEVREGRMINAAVDMALAGLVDTEISRPEVDVALDMSVDDTAEYMCDSVLTQYFEDVVTQAVAPDAFVNIALLEARRLPSSKPPTVPRPEAAGLPRAHPPRQLQHSQSWHQAPSEYKQELEGGNVSSAEVDADGYDQNVIDELADEFDRARGIGAYSAAQVRFRGTDATLLVTKVDLQANMPTKIEEEGLVKQQQKSRSAAKQETRRKEREERRALRHENRLLRSLLGKLDTTLPTYDVSDDSSDEAEDEDEKEEEPVRCVETPTKPLSEHARQEQIRQWAEWQKARKQQQQQQQQQQAAGAVTAAAIASGAEQDSSSAISSSAEPKTSNVNVQTGAVSVSGVDSSKAWSPRPMQDKSQTQAQASMSSSLQGEDLMTGSSSDAAAAADGKDAKGQVGDSKPSHKQAPAVPVIPVPVSFSNLSTYRTRRKSAALRVSDTADNNADSLEASTPTEQYWAMIDVLEESSVDTALLIAGYQQLTNLYIEEQDYRSGNMARERANELRNVSAGDVPHLVFQWVMEALRTAADVDQEAVTGAAVRLAGLEKKLLQSKTDDEGEELPTARELHWMKIDQLEAGGMGKTDPKQLLKAYEELALACAKCGDLHGARQATDHARLLKCKTPVDRQRYFIDKLEEEDTVDTEALSIAYNELAQLYAALGSVAEAKVAEENAHRLHLLYVASGMQRTPRSVWLCDRRTTPFSSPREQAEARRRGAERREELVRRHEEALQKREEKQKLDEAEREWKLQQEREEQAEWERQWEVSRQKESKQEVLKAHSESVYLEGLAKQNARREKLLREQEKRRLEYQEQQAAMVRKFQQEKKQLELELFRAEHPALGAQEEEQETQPAQTQAVGSDSKQSESELEAKSAEIRGGDDIMDVLLSDDFAQGRVDAQGQPVTATPRTEATDGDGDRDRDGDGDGDQDSLSLILGQEDLADMTRIYQSSPASSRYVETASDAGYEDGSAFGTENSAGTYASNLGSALDDDSVPGSYAGSTDAMNDINAHAQGKDSDSKDSKGYYHTATTISAPSPPAPGKVGGAVVPRHKRAPNPALLKKIAAKEEARKLENRRLKRLLLIRRAEEEMRKIDVQIAQENNEKVPPRVRILSDPRTLPEFDAARTEKVARNIVTNVRIELSGGQVDKVDAPLSHSEKLLLESPFATPYVDLYKAKVEKEEGRRRLEHLKSVVSGSLGGDGGSSAVRSLAKPVYIHPMDTTNFGGDHRHHRRVSAPSSLVEPLPGQYVGNILSVKEKRKYSSRDYST